MALKLIENVHQFSPLRFNNYTLARTNKYDFKDYANELLIDAYIKVIIFFKIYLTQSRVFPGNIFKNNQQVSYNLLKTTTTKHNIIL